MTTTISGKDIKWVGNYYPHWREMLRLLGRNNVPELNNESPEDPGMAIERAMATMAHLLSVQNDYVARNLTVPTANHRASLAALFYLINYSMSLYLPATATLISTLSQVFTSTDEVLAQYALFGTKGTEEAAAVNFEYLADTIDIDRTDQVYKFFAEESSVFTDYTTEANAGTPFSPWATPVANDKFYLAHQHIIWNKLSLEFATPAANISGVWEFYNGVLDFDNPTDVTDLGATLKFDLTSVYGTEDHSGGTATVRLNETGISESLTVQFGGGINYITTTNLMGQITPSTDEGDYSVGSLWLPLPSVTDGTSDLTVDGDVECTIPYNKIASGGYTWQKVEVDGVNAYWMRYRITGVSGPTAPSVDVVDIGHKGYQHLVFDVTQGRTIQSDILGTSDGSANQSFTLSTDKIIQDTVVMSVDEGGGYEAWIEQPNFFASNPTDKHFTIYYEDENNVTTTFGNGTNGKIPANTASIKSLYRVEADNDGNVGIEQINQNVTGSSFLKQIKNSRVATGWTNKEGHNAASLEEAKINGTQSARVNENAAITAEDFEYHVKNYFTTSAGASPVERAYVDEGYYTAAHHRLLVVGTTGGLLSQSVLDEIDLYFNGSQELSITSHIVINNQITTVNFTPKVIDLTMTIKVVTNTTGLQQRINNSLSAFLAATSKDVNNTYNWNLGAGFVYLDQIQDNVMQVDPGNIKSVVISSHSLDIPLLTNEMPAPGTYTINMSVI